MNVTQFSKYFRIKFVLVLTLFSGFTAAAENERHIHINGEHLNETNIQLLDRIVGSNVGDGYYWLNMQTGQWGFEGNNQIQGVITSIANQTHSSNQQAEQQSSFNEEANRYNDWEGVDSNGGVVSGTVDGKNCTYVSVAGMTMKDCD